MTAALLSLPRAGTPAPFVPADVDVHAVDGCHLDLPDLRDSDWIRTLDLAERGAVSILHMESMRGRPGGSLPNDDRLLASYLGFSVREVDQFLAMKARVLQGWVLCSDGRLHHPLRAKNVLRLWIGWRETNRRSALGNGARNAEVRRGVREIEADIEEAAAALRDLDPKDKFLDDLEVRMSKWSARSQFKAIDTDVTAAVTSSEEDVTATVTSGHTPLDGCHKLSEAKLSETDSSSPQRGDDSSGSQNLEPREFDTVKGSANRTPEQTVTRVPIAPWPPDWLARFKARYPRKEAWGRAEKVLERLRKAGRVAFDDILLGIERLVAKNRPHEFTPLPATWLNDRGWEDEPEPPPGSGRPHPRGRDGPSVPSDPLTAAFRNLHARMNAS